MELLYWLCKRHHPPILLLSSDLGSPSWLQVVATKGLAKVLSLWVPFSSPTQQSVNYFYANHYLFQLDDIFYAGMAYVLIFCAGLFDRPRDWNLYALGSPTRKIGGSQVSNWAGVIAVVITSWWFRWAWLFSQRFPMASIQNRPKCKWIDPLYHPSYPYQFQSVPQLVGDCDYPGA